MTQKSEVIWKNCYILWYVILLIFFLDWGSSGCGGYGVLTAETGFVKSHQAHGSLKYSNNKDCSWNIEAPAGRKIRLEILNGIKIEDHNKYVCLIGIW